MGRIDVFVAPRPNPALINVMTIVNRIVMLRGVPGFRDFLPFNRLAGLRGVANVRHIDFPAADQQKLQACCGAGQATFITPNHPEFFTDWMIDKEVVSRVSPLAASWATHGVVNGLGRPMQKFWLANNLIAQIPGNNEAAKAHSVDWALKGHGVLLHPEGGVGWHGNFVGPLLPGAVGMGLEALQRGREMNKEFNAWVAPVVWKLAFTGNVEQALARECAYVEKSLKIEGAAGGSPSERVYRIYSTLLSRDERACGLTAEEGAPYAVRQQSALAELGRQVAAAIAAEPGLDMAELLRHSRRWLREGKADADEQKRVRKLTETIQRIQRVGPWAFANQTITQEEIAEHLKRIRNDYCKGTLRDTINRFIPQPAGPRCAHIRVPEPLGLHAYGGSIDEALVMLRSRMQQAVTGIVAELQAGGGFISYPNPFYHH
ncbi:hypothetical protein EN836_05420 [Mesorhizobium sp. M1C.F.Ca.ET.193.01.1.1]|uniref:hypothetical protein n=1 Tax=unclassified Mesorhizobium TaxID=325217 RepID=UPI000FD4859D|nr:MULTISPECIES: hypothetical protein [unclassified Mesorhizobium]TGT03523.1 hypothetical protein EN820_21355 [bacterium M00.F.Ca.ET.177.01.1.1]TGQ56207.1 hypothetical protein EN853_05415 [Mesorhizobium sp. M1C.F.Ca.ET.210.01.1.1]TGQ75292.1 hypothetical protein EN855_005425 [Mesorhizobium sp. M1C.F.Ca.ET.212.01.1.1]TGR13704.1 hypothetical protein EN847_05420 [Mesorhizobium sp. M1C.F.Ca.ET.204.01.1.1]TGR33979.1 hypothetical protein EN839_05420 [Mesorhizobium sp. M1C.F.Ca.ET.196.01.1.1]